MPDPSERFIEAATRSLGDNAELQLMAAQELRAAISAMPEGAGGDSLEEAAANLENGRSAGRWKVILYAMTALVAILAAIPVARDYMRLRLAIYGLFAMTDHEAVALPGLPLDEHAGSRVPEIIGDFSPSERLLLFGDLSKADQPDRFKALWNSEPDNPAYFAEFARACVERGSLPPDFLRTADRLDPQNAWFRYLAAGVAARGAVEETGARYLIRKRGGNHSKYRITDPVGVAEAMKLLAEAARMPRSDSYEESLLLRRLEILPAGDDVLGRKLTKSYLEMVPPGSRWINRHITQAVAARSEELAAAGNSREFLTLVESWEAFVRRLIEAGGSSLTIFWPSGDLKAAAKALGLERQEARFAGLVKAMESRKSASVARRSHAVPLGEKGGASAYEVRFARMTIDDPPALTAGDLKPGRMAEHAMLQRSGSVIVAGLMGGVALLVTAMWFCRGVQVRRLSGALSHVLRPADHAWILLGGVGIPVVIHLLVEQLASSEGAGVGGAGALMSVALRYFALAGLMLTLPNLIAGRRLGQRLGCLGWGKPKSFAAGLIAAASGVSVIAEITGGDSGFNVGWAVVSFILVVGFLILPMGVFISARHEVARWFAYCRAVVPAYVLGVLLMALLVPFHHAREKHWTRLNVLTKIEPGVPAMNRYEHEVAKLMQAELIEILNAKP